MVSLLFFYERTNARYSTAGAVGYVDIEVLLSYRPDIWHVIS